MLATDEFLSSPPKKTVRFGGTLAEILRKYQKGETTGFDLLKHQLSDPDIKDEQLISWLQEFRCSVALLTKEFEQLVGILLKVPWLRRGKAVEEEFLAFLSSLVSAQTVFLRPCLAMIASNFVPPRITAQEDDADIFDSYDEKIPADVTRAFDTCHGALQTVVRYVPLTPQFLMPVLTEKFPVIFETERTLQCYVQNVLRISGYIPALKRDILELVIERLLKIDVMAPGKDIKAAEEEEEAEERLFDMEEDESREKSDQMAHPLAECLDILMVVLFSYIKDGCHVNGKLDIGRTKDLYRDLVAVFDKFILPTHGSCHVQFMMFYLSSFKLGIAEAFVEHLWKKLQNPNNPAVFRQSAATYIGSFLARAKFIPVVTVKACLELLASWIHQYIDTQGTGSRAFCDAALHGPFYAACQAVFYVVIFRQRQILDGNLKEGLAFLQRLNFERIVMCQLNPLMVCLPSIANLFAAVSRKYQIAFCDTILERNWRQVLPVVRSSGGGDSVQTCTNPLESFFPFDPCILKRSQKIIHPFYEYWEEQDVDEVTDAAETAAKGKGEEEDDFLKGETPQNDSLISMIPGSFDSPLQSPDIAEGSPPVTSR